MTNGYSANVRLALKIGGRTLPLSQIGPNQIVLREPTLIEPSDAEVHMEVDGRARYWTVRIPHGCKNGNVALDVEICGPPIYLDAPMTAADSN